MSLFKSSLRVLLQTKIRELVILCSVLPCVAVMAEINPKTKLFRNLPVRDTAENVAEKYGISRERQDAFAYQSQQRTAAAMENAALLLSQ